jgi:hypothetical protein
MKINDIYESTTAGSIATVATPMSTQKRNDVGKGVYGNEKAGNLLTGKKTNKKYANSVNESFDTKQKVIDYFVKNGKTAGQGAAAWERGWRGKSAKKTNEPVANKPRVDYMAKYDLDEAKLDEDDLIIVPGQGRSRKNGFIKHGESRLDHEVEMARSDLFSAAKNAKQVYELIADVSEEEGLEGWVQEKIIKANDYLNTIREYLEGKQLQNEMTGGVIAGGGVGEGIVDKIKGAVRREKAKDLPLLQTRRDYATMKAGDEYAKGEPRKGSQYMAWAERDRKKKGDPSTNPMGTYRTKTSDYTNEAQSLGGALKNSLAKAEPGSKLDNSIKTHNRNIKAGNAGTLKNAPTGYHFDSKGYCKLGDK